MKHYYDSSCNCEDCYSFERALQKQISSNGESADIKSGPYNVSPRELDMARSRSYNSLEERQHKLK